jgi:hypothetical protein
MNTRPRLEEGYAQQRLGRTLQAIGGQFGDLAMKVLRSQIRSEVVQGQLSYEDAAREFQEELRKDTDYASWPSKFEQWHDNKIAEISGQKLTPASQKALTEWGQAKRNQLGTQITAQSWTLTARNERALLDATVEGAILSGDTGEMEIQMDGMVEDGLLTPNERLEYRQRVRDGRKALLRERAKLDKEQALRNDIDSQVERINSMSIADRMAEVRALKGYENVDRNEIKARVQSQIDAETEAIEKTFTRQWVDAQLTRPTVLAAGLPSDLEKKWLTDIKKQYEEKETATESERLEAREQFDEKISQGDKEGARKLLMDDAWMFTTADNEQRYNTLNDPPAGSNDPVMKDAIDAIDRMLTLEEKAAGQIPKDEEGQKKFRERRASALRRSLEKKQQVREWFRSNPDATPSEKNRQVETILSGISKRQEGHVRDEVQKWWQTVGKAVTKDYAVAPGLTYGGIGGVGMLEGVVQKPTAEERKKSREAMQAIWEQLTKEEKETAMQALRQGKTAKEIIEYFEAHK